MQTFLAIRPLTPGSVLFFSFILIIFFWVDEREENPRDSAFALALEPWLELKKFTVQERMELFDVFYSTWERELWPEDWEKLSPKKHLALARLQVYSSQPDVRTDIRKELAQAKQVLQVFFWHFSFFISEKTFNGSEPTATPIEMT